MESVSPQIMDFIRKGINVKFVITGKSAREQIWDIDMWLEKQRKN